LKKYKLLNSLKTSLALLFSSTFIVQGQLLEIEIRAKAGLQFNKVRFEAKPGQKVVLDVYNDDQMAHNLVFTKEGKRQAVANLALTLGEEAEAKNWVPDTDDVLWATPVLKPGENHKLKFTAPNKSGVYPYVCTFIGHGFVMYGAMYVGKDMPEIAKDMNVPELARTGGVPNEEEAIVANGALKNFRYSVYEGDWNKLPDFEKLKPVKTGEAKSGIADTSFSKKRDNFGIVMEGELEIKKKGEYTFNLGSDDGSRLLINGVPVVVNDGIHGVVRKSGSTNLNAGVNLVRIEYFEKGGGEHLSLDMSGPGIKKLQLARNTAPKNSQKNPYPTGNPIIPENNEAVMYRNFIEGASPRGIGVGYPEKVNLCFDANTMQIAILWHGTFIDGAKHWTNRGQGFQKPSGHYLMNLSRDQPFAVLENSDSEWPKVEGRDTRAEKMSFGGYRLKQKNRHPVFQYQIAGLRVTDYPEPQGGSMPSIIRHLEIQGNGEVYYLAASGKNITEKNGFYSFSDSMLQVGFPDKENLKPIIRENAGRQELLLKIELDGRVAFKQHYRWNVDYIMKNHTHGHQK